MKIVVATKNKGKIEEIKNMFKRLDVEILSIDYEDIEENGTTFEQNSLIKAVNVKKLTPYAVISDDSGLCIDELDNWPGINTARIFPDIKTYDLKCKKMIEILDERNLKNRDAHFVSVITFIDYDGNYYQFRGETKGYIENKLLGENGHGYDPIFFSYELNKTFGQASLEEKEKVSHRGRAFSKLYDFLVEKINNK